MNEYKVYLLHEEISIRAPNIYQAKARSCRLYKQAHPTSKYTWTTLMSIVRVKKMSWAF